MDTMPAAPTMHLARVIRSSEKAATTTRVNSCAIVVDSGVRIVVETGADVSTLTMVLEVVRGRR
jgi:hypothetical protein